MVVCALFTPVMVLTPKLSASVRFNSFRSSAWIWENLRKQCKTAAITCLHYFQIGYGLLTCTLVLFQCNQPADGKYQSKVLEEGTSKDFGSQDKSFPEGTFWINLVRSSQQSFSLRIFPSQKKICKYSTNAVAWGWKVWKFLRAFFVRFECTSHLPYPEKL